MVRTLAIVLCALLAASPAASAFWRNDTAHGAVPDIAEGARGKLVAQLGGLIEMDGSAPTPRIPTGAREALALGMPGETPPPPAGALDEEIVSLYLALGLEIPAADAWETTLAQQRALDPDLESSLAELVAALRGHHLAVRGAQEVWSDPAVFLREASAVLSPTSLAVAAAVDRVIASASLGEDAPGSVVFADPFSLVVVGGEGANLYSGNTAPPTARLARSFQVATIDLGGDDVYENNAGGAGHWPLTCPAVPGCAARPGAAVAIDLGGADVYRAPTPGDPAQGAGVGGAIGILVDLAGDDLYAIHGMRRDLPQPTLFGSHMFVGQGAASLGGFGLLLDRSGDDHYHASLGYEGLYPGLDDLRTSTDVAVQGAVLTGVGLLVDGEGSDEYVAEATCDGLGDWGACSIGLASQGGAAMASLEAFIAPGSVALLLDGGRGSDRYHSSAAAVNHVTLQRPSPSMITSISGVVAQGASAGYGALAAAIDEGGDDTRTIQASTIDNEVNWYYSRVFGFGSASADGSIAIFWDRDGDDTYLSSSKFSAPNARPWPTARVFGVGYYSAEALFLDEQGHDRYRVDMPVNLMGETSGAKGAFEVSGFGYTFSPSGYGNVPGIASGWFVDLAGDDTHEIDASNWPTDRPLWVASHVFGAGYGDFVDDPTITAPVPCDAVAASIGGSDLFRLSAPVTSLAPLTFGEGHACAPMFVSPGGYKTFEGFPGISNGSGLRVEASGFRLYGELPPPAVSP